MISGISASSVAIPTLDATEGLQGDARPDLREAAEAFEAVFLTEMLSHAGMGAQGGGLGGQDFDGGAGEDAFASLLTREWATRLTAEGGLGLSDAIYAALLAKGVPNE